MKWRIRPKSHPAFSHKKVTELPANTPRPAPETLIGVLLRLPDKVLVDLKSGLSEFVAILKIKDIEEVRSMRTKEGE